VSNKQKRGGTLAPNRGVALMGARNRVGQHQQRRNTATWLERMQATAARQRELKNGIV
jgi:hypothetical protein